MYSTINVQDTVRLFDIEVDGNPHYYVEAMISPPTHHDGTENTYAGSHFAYRLKSVDGMDSNGRHLAPDYVVITHCYEASRDWINKADAMWVWQPSPTCSSRSYNHRDVAKSMTALIMRYMVEYYEAGGYPKGRMSLNQEKDLDRLFFGGPGNTSLNRQIFTYINACDEVVWPHYKSGPFKDRIWENLQEIVLNPEEFEGESVRNSYIEMRCRTFVAGDPAHVEHLEQEVA